MALDYILSSLVERYGWDAEEQRTLLLKKINRAAAEVYKQADHPGSLKEIVLNVSANNILALPSYIGEIRAVRGHDLKDKVELKAPEVQYSFRPWGEICNVWRMLGKSPIKTSITDAAPFTFSIPATEATDIVITITGQTTAAQRRTETVTITAGQLEAQNALSFIDVVSIVKNRITTGDVTIEDEDAVEIAVIPNDQLRSSYILIDVSLVPSLGDGSTRQVDVLYKQNLLTFVNDEDEFPCPGLDDAIVYKALELEYSSQADGGDKAIGFYRKCEQVIYQNNLHQQGNVQKEMIFKPNRFVGLFNLGRWNIGKLR